jgi:hypothetical protein
VERTCEIVLREFGNSANKDGNVGNSKPNRVSAHSNPFRGITNFISDRIPKGHPIPLLTQKIQSPVSETC